LVVSGGKSQREEGVTLKRASVYGGIATARGYLLAPLFLWTLSALTQLAIPCAARGFQRVTVVGSFQRELGCPSDWDSRCETTRLVYDPVGDMWRGTWELPPGKYEYRLTLEGSRQATYGAGSEQEGPSIPLVVRDPGQVTFYYDHKSHWITDSLNSAIVTVPGSYQRALGCESAWDPACMRSWLQDPDGDGMYELSTRGIPAGTYECRVAMDGGWEENYGEGGDRDGANIVFAVTKDRSLVTFTYDSNSHVLRVEADLREVESASTSCQSTQDCLDRLGSDWECDSGLCVQIHIQDGDSSTTCVFSSLLGKNNPALDSIRRFRDEVLKKYTLGRKVINLYYRHQEEIVSLLDKNPHLKPAVKTYVERLAALIETFLGKRAK
jgi:hypothetical protein